MRFYELLKKYSDDQIVENLKKNYNDIVEEAYLVALNELRELSCIDEKQNIEIYVEFVNEDNNRKFLQCGGIGLNEEGDMIHWGLEFDSWEVWLSI